MARAAALLLVFLAAAVPVPAQLFGAVTVTDGDTLRLGAERVRLHGIDAPESKQTCRAGGETWRCGAAVTRAHRRRVIKMRTDGMTKGYVAFVLIPWR